MASKEPTKPYFMSGSRKSDAELDWEADCKIARDESKHEFSVAPQCTVPQRDGPTLHAGDKVDPDRIEGGLPQVLRWARPNDRYVLRTDERTVKTNRGEYEFTTKKSWMHNGQIYVPPMGFNSDELDVPGGEPYETFDINTRRIVRREGRPPVVGAELAESLIKRELAERARLRDKVTAAVKKRLKREAKVESAKAGG